MSGDTAPNAPRKIGRGYGRNLDAGSFQPMISSFELHLRAEKKSPKTIRTYLEAAQWMAAEYLIPAGLRAGLRSAQPPPLARLQEGRGAGLPRGQV